MKRIFLIGPNGLGMKRPVKINANFSDLARVEFLIFMFFYKYNQIKNLAYFVNMQKPLGKPIIAMFYARCWL